jgi:hypothetical protein
MFCWSARLLCIGAGAIGVWDMAADEFGIVEEDL